MQPGEVLAAERSSGRRPARISPDLPDAWAQAATTQHINRYGRVLLFARRGPRTVEVGGGQRRGAMECNSND